MKTILRIVFPAYLLFTISQVGFGQNADASAVRNNSGLHAAYDIVFDGNSWVAGSRSTGGSNYPSQVKMLLEKDGYTVDLLNCGVPGQTIDQMQTAAPAKVDPQHSTKKYLIGLELVNQWGLSKETREVIYAKYKNYFLARKAAGFKNVIALTPIAQGYYPRTNWEVDRKWFAARMLAEFPGLGIQVVDVGGDARLSDWKDGRYFSSDHIHPSNEGYAVMASLVYRKIRSMK